MSDYIPHGETALRLGWRFLPVGVRAAVERQVGSAVVSGESRDAGFTSGFASVLTCENGTRHFVKAVAVRAQQQIVEHYRREAKVLALLPAGLPVPRLCWQMEVEDWFVFSTQFHAGQSPQRPWQLGDVALALDACEKVVRFGTPAPSGLPSLVDALADAPDQWDLLPSGSVPPDQLLQAQGLSRQFPDVLGGDTLVHSDLRDDQIMLSSKAAALVDWNWACVGADWFDSLVLLIGPRGDGLDVEAIISQRPLLRTVPPESIDIVLALLAGYLLGSACQPVPANSPHLRDAQWWQGEVCWNWLAERRGWPQPSA